MDRTIYCDIDKCTGCGACVVACMDENDVDVFSGEIANRRISMAECEGEGRTLLHFASVSCMHCEDSPCLIGCPTGAIYRDIQTNAIMVNQDNCIGCHSCAIACPFGVPRYDRENKLTKCDLCADRVKAGLIPACVRICPVSALTFTAANQVSKEREDNYIGKIFKHK